MDEELELSEEVRELFLAGALDGLLEHVAKVGSEAARDESRKTRNEESRIRMAEKYRSDGGATRERQAEYVRNRRASDPEYVERMREYQRSRDRSNRDREGETRRQRERIQSDPEYRERMLENTRRWRARNSTSQAERYKSDPEYRERKKRQQREYYARKKAEKEAQENNERQTDND